MSESTVFDIIGPIMVGPSSSHTAGAVRLGRMAAKILGCPVQEADVFLHGSLDRTGEGHGTRTAIAAGLLGLQPDDEELPMALTKAQESGVKIAYHSWDGGDVHPNTALFRLKGGEPARTCEVIGSSIGGGRIVISSIDSFRVDFTGDYPTLILLYQDYPGMIAAMTSILAEERINIAQMKVSREGKGKGALAIIETDQLISKALRWRLSKQPTVQKVIFVQPL